MSLNSDPKFLEQFLFSEDRLKLVAESFPKTSENFWYYRLLTLQRQFGDSNKKEAKKLAGALDQVERVKEVKESEALANLKLRQDLINFGSSTGAVRRQAIVKLKGQLQPKLDHQQEDGAEAKRTGRAAASTYQSQLVISTQQIVKKKWDDMNLRPQPEPHVHQVFTPCCFSFLANQKLTPAQIHNFLNMNAEEAPEIPYLLTLVRKDLTLNKGAPFNVKFGDKKLHFKLTREQLELLGKKTKELEGNEEYLKAYALKLRNVGDADLENNTQAKGKYLEKLKKWALERGGKCPNLTACILYNSMKFQEEQGRYDKTTLRKYLAVPKRTPYNEGTPAAEGKSQAQLDYVPTVDGRRIPTLGPIGDDEPFVRRALRYCFSKSEENVGKWKDVVTLSYARKLQAEVRLVNGAGNAADLRKTLNKYAGKTAYDELAARVDIELPPDNKKFYDVEDPVVIKLLVKNVPELTVNVYELNAKGFYTLKEKEIDLGVDVSGLEPTIRTVKTYGDAPILKRERVIDVPQLRGKRGLFLIEFVGNGQKARSLIRKGELRFIVRQEVKDENKDGGLGYYFRVINEKNADVKKARVTIAGKEYDSDKTGRVFVPFAEVDNPAQAVVVEDTQRPGSATLHFFKYQTENYDMRCGLYIDRESLLEKQQAKVFVRPALFLNEQPVSIENLREPKLTVVTTDGEGNDFTKVVNIRLSDNRETVYRFTVPTELRQVRVALTGVVRRVSQECDLTLRNEETYKINAIDDTAALADLHLIPRGASGYVLACYGKNGEARSNQVINVKLSHRYLLKELSYTLETNDDGLIFLGRLPDVTKVVASAQGEEVFTNHEWNLLKDQVNVPPIVNVKQGSVVKIPYMSADAGPRVDVYDIDYIMKFKSVSYKGGYIEIRGLPVGDFIAYIRDQQNAEVLIHVAKGSTFDGHVISDSRIVEMTEGTPLQITQVKGNKAKGYKVQLEGFNKLTRVHVISNYLVPRFTGFSFLAAPISAPQVTDFQQQKALYGAQEPTTDEARYIAARKKATKFPGNGALPPSMLTSAWTPTPNIQRGAESLQQPRQPRPSEMRITPRFASRMNKVLGTDVRRSQDPSQLEFLSSPSQIFENMPVDGSGWVSVPPEATQSNLLQVIAIDDNNISMRNVILQATSDKEKMKDVRMAEALDPEKHYTEVREVVVLPKTGDSLTIENWATSQIETYDDLTDTYDLYLAVAGDRSRKLQTSLGKFEFLTKWNEMSDEDKLAAYSEFACHEVNLFISRRDSDFFNKVVKPALANKFTKDFMDKYLLDEKLDCYLGLTQFRTLNTLERILLASKVESIAKNTLRAIEDGATSIEEDPRQSDALFKKALQAKQLTAELLEQMLSGVDDTGVEMTQRADGDLTREFQETRYYGVPFKQQDASLVKPTRFWLDIAKYYIGGGSGALLSQYFGYATSNLNEMLLALALCDLPYRSDVAEPTLTYETDKRVVVTVNNPTILLSRQIKETSFKTAALSVSTNYFDPDDPWEVVDFERQDKFLQMPLATRKIYGCRIVITNVSSVAMSVEILAQIPTGSVPVKNGFRTKNMIVELPPYKTTKREFYFYFPRAGDFFHFPTHVTKNGNVLGFGLESHEISVVDPDTIVDTTSWAYYAKKATDKELLEYLKNTETLSKLDLGQIAWRMQSEKLFIATTNILRSRQAFNEDIWGYSMKHFAEKEYAEYLAMSQRFQDYFKPDFTQCTLADYDSLHRRDYQYTEFWPLLNARAHGQEVANTDFQKQYLAQLQRSVFRSFSRASIPTEDRMSLVYLLLCQDRVSTAQEIFGEIDEGAAKKVSSFNYDYLKAYLAFSSGDVGAMTEANKLASAYTAKTLPPSQRRLWETLAAHLAEVKDINADGGVFNPPVVIPEPALDIDITEDRLLKVNYTRVPRVTCNFYKVDLELQFSTAAFHLIDGAFNFVQPTVTREVELDANAVNASANVEIPMEVQNQNSVVEVIGGNITVAKPDYENTLRVQVSKDIGDIRVLDSRSGRAIAKAYVKVYSQGARAPDGEFFKDGYTDLRGRFNYMTSSSDQLSGASKLAILVLTETNGADVISVDL